MAAAPNPCFHCRNGNGDKCTAVGCYRCDCGCRDRHHGLSVTDQPLRHAPGMRFGQLNGVDQ